MFKGFFSKKHGRRFLEKDCPDMSPRSGELSIYCPSLRANGGYLMKFFTGVIPANSLVLCFFLHLRKYVLLVFQFCVNPG